MAGPWEAYQTNPPEPAGPWEAYKQAPAPAADSGGLNQRAGSFATGINDTLAAAAGAPMDISAWLGNQLGRGVNAITGRDIFQARPTIGGSGGLRQALGSVVGRTEPQDMADRLLYGAGSGVGSTVAGMGVGGALGAAARAPQVASALTGPGTAGGTAGNIALGGASGVGAVIGEEVAGDNPIARMLGGFTGGLAPGALVAGGALARGLRPLATPTEAELKASGSARFNAARAAGVDVTGDTVANAMAAKKADLLRQGFLDTPELAPGTHGIIDRYTSPTPGAFATFDDLQAARRAFGNLARNYRNPTDAAAARQAQRAVDDMVGTLGPNDLRGAPGVNLDDYAQVIRDARGDYAAAQRANQLTGALDRATTGGIERAQQNTASANSGANLDNSLRQQLKSLRRNKSAVAGLSDDEIAAIDKVIEGGPVTNFARYWGNFFGGGGGIGQSGLATGGATLGALLSGGNPAASVIGGLAPAAIGKSMKGLENRLSLRAANAAADLMRRRSPLYRQMLAGQQPFDGNAAVLQSLMPGLLATLAEQQTPIPGLLQ